MAIVRWVLATIDGCLTASSLRDPRTYNWSAHYSASRPKSSTITEQANIKLLLCPCLSMNRDANMSVLVTAIHLGKTLQALYNYLRKKPDPASSPMVGSSGGEHSESSGKKYAHFFIKVGFSNCYYPRLWHLVSRASEVSGSTGCLGNRLRFVASTRSGSPGGDRPQRARISNGRGRSRFRHRCLPELYPRMDAARKGPLRRLILGRVARSGLRLPLLPPTHWNDSELGEVSS